MLRKLLAPAIAGLLATAAPAAAQSIGGGGPIGASTAAKQDTGNTSLATIAGRSVAYAETATPLSGSATFTGGTARDTGAAAGTATPWAAWAATFIADQAGTASVLCSNDNFSTTYTCATAALAASTALTLKVPTTFRYFKPKLVNGATPQTSLVVTSAFLAN